jgi:hypothetical protein
MYFQQNFINWTSGNNDIDKFIQDSQLSVHDNYKISEALEWIPYNRFYDHTKYIAKSWFSEVHKAKWTDGFIDRWDIEHQNWIRRNQNIIVELKSIDILKNMNEVFLIFCFMKFEIFNF